jgi:protein-glutamine gamma-glutamyltransferase
VSVEATRADDWRAGVWLSPAPRKAARPARHLPASVLRLVPFAAFAVFVALRWGAILDPAATGRAWVLAGISLALALTLLLAGRLPRALGHVSAALAALVALAFSLLAAGAPARDLKPRHWHSLVDGISSGLSSLPGIVTPYSGGDRWTHIVILAGAAGGLVLAAAIGFWPRRSGNGWPLAALVALIGLAAVPASVLEGGSAAVQGVILFILAAAFIASDRLAAVDAPVAVPILGSLAAVAVVLAPAIDVKHPWIDYQAAADSLAAKGEGFDWTQGYGPLHWPRTSHVVLRIKAKHAAYWKTENLDVFDGTRWRAAPPGVQGATGQLAPGAGAHPEWVQKIDVTVRGMRSHDMITAGDASSITGSTRPVASSDQSPGTFVAKRALGSGDYYSATVYTPRPSPAQLEAAGASYPEDIAPSLMLQLSPVGPRVYFPPDASPIVPGHHGEDATARIEHSHYGRTYRLAQRLSATASTPYEYAQAVQRYLAHGFTYTETPPPSKVPLEAFLWRNKQGYCQQFAGAMAVLLRMGGVPARVAVGFAPGRYDRQDAAWLVRDDEAHAWVEAWFPGIGWVTFDPTPAVAPALGQLSTNRESPTPGAGFQGLQGIYNRQRDPASATSGSVTPAAPSKGHGSGSSDLALWLGLGGGLAALGGVATALLLRRRRRGPGGDAAPDAFVAELERALHRAGRDLRPGTTLRQLEDRFGRTSDARPYVAAVRGLRYGSGKPPTPGERRGLRRELGRGLGPIGQLRAWWAVPPRLS